MKGTRLFKLTVVALALAVWACAPTHDTNTNGGPPQQEGALSSTVPGPSTQLKPDQTSFDNFAWRVFVALSWPAAAEGGPDTKAVIGQRADGPSVWETFADPEAIFFSDACSRPHGARGAAEKVLTRIRKRIEKLSSANDTQAAPSWPLVDQASNFVLYETLVNDTQADYICANKLTSLDNIATFVADGKKVSFPAGSIEVKAAWRLFPPDTPPEVLARYHTRPARINVSNEQPADTSQPNATPTPTPGGELRGRVGLVGLHITYKTQGQPRWLWATFEQVDNYKVDYKPLPGLKATFNSGTPPSSPDAYNRQPLPLQPAPDPQKVKYVWSSTQPTAAAYHPTEVWTCPNDIPPSPVNAEWQQRLAQAGGVENSPWQYYRLDSVQWFDANDKIQPRNSDGAAVLRNSVLETYVLGDQTIANQVPAIGLVSTNVNPLDPPQGTLADTIVAEMEAMKYPQVNTGENTWSSCVLCHQMALYTYGVKDCKYLDVMTDYSFVFRSFLSPAAKPSTCPK
jgi:hypothetical protein